MLNGLGVLKWRFFAIISFRKNNKIKSAALDSCKEETPENSLLVELENIIMISHNGAYAKEAINNMGFKQLRI